MKTRDRVKDTEELMNWFINVNEIKGKALNETQIKNTLENLNKMDEAVFYMIYFDNQKNF